MHLKVDMLKQLNMTNEERKGSHIDGYIQARLLYLTCPTSCLFVCRLLYVDFLPSRVHVGV